MQFQRPMAKVFYFGNFFLECSFTCFEGVAFQARGYGGEGELRSKLSPLDFGN